MARPAAELQAKHYKALELIEDGSLTYKEIATACSIPADSFYDLIEGNIEKAGSLAALFHAEVRKITQRSQTKIRQLTHDNKKLALLQLNDRLKNLKKKTKLTREDSAELTKIVNSLSKLTPSVEINSLSIHKGLTDRDLVNEFKRLRSISEHALNGKTIPRFREGRSGVLLDAIDGRDSDSESE